MTEVARLVKRYGAVTAVNGLTSGGVWVEAVELAAPFAGPSPPARHAPGCAPGAGRCAAGGSSWI